MDSRKSLARIAGFLYLAMMPFAAFWLSQRFALAAPGDPARTAATMAASEGLLRASIVSWLIAQTIFVFLCFGYLFDAARGMLLPDVGLVVSQFTFVGELLLPLWLVTKGPSVDFAGPEPAAENH